MKISLFQGILIAIFGLGALAGLFVFATYSSSGGGASKGVGTVMIWGTLPQDGVSALLTQLTQTDSSYKDVSYVQKDPSTLSSDLASAIATGAAPDLVLASQEQLLSLERFLQPVPLATLPANTFNSSFTSEAELLAAPGGQGYWGVPFLVDPLVLYANRTILSSNGVATPPTTWESLTGLVPALASLTPNRQISRALIALGGYGNITDARAILSLLFLQTGAGLSVPTGTGGYRADLGVSADSGVAPGHSALSFYTQFADPSKVSYTWNASLPNSQSSFLAGDLALYLGFASEASYLTQANPNLNFQVSPAPQPATASTRKTYGLVYAFMIPRGAKNSSGGFQIAAQLTSDAPQQLAAAATGLAPASLSALSKPPTDNPAGAVAYASALYADGWLSPDPASTDRIFSGMINDVISGRSDIDTALSSAESTLGSLLPQ